MGQSMGTGAVRIAVKDEATNKRMINIIKQVITRSCDTEVAIQETVYG
jgi:histidinol-phosphate/aromatic aminotransferase/cobyric acid decarboxylase-like protein